MPSAALRAVQTWPSTLRIPLGFESGQPGGSNLQRPRNPSAVPEFAPQRRPGLRPDPRTLALWLEASAAGDRQAFRCLFDATSPTLNALLRRMVLSPSDAEDLLVEVYAKVWRAAASFDASRGPALTWMAVIARRHALDHLRRGRRRRDAELRAVAPGPSEPPGPQDLGSQAEDRERLARAVGTLAPEQREAIRVVFFDGCSHAEAAARLKQPLGTLKGRVRSALRQMRAALEPPRGSTT